MPANQSPSQSGVWHSIDSKDWGKMGLLPTECNITFIL